MEKLGIGKLERKEEIQMESYWVQTTTRPSFLKLEKNISTDGCIIGAGITGIMTAYMLLKSGLKICLIDKGEICSGVTKNTTAKITSQHNLIYRYLEDTFGEEFARKYLKSNEEAIELIEEIVKKEQIDCEFKRIDNYIYTCTDEYIQRIKDEADTLKRLGQEIELIDKIDLPFEIKLGIKTPNQAIFHPLKYLYRIVEILKQNNVEIYTNSRVKNIERNEKKYKVKTEENIINAKYVVMATHYPIKSFPGLHFLKMYQDRSYAIAIEPHSKISKGMFISAETPVASFRPISEEFLIIGGQDHKTGDNSKDLDICYKSIETYAKEIYPSMKTKYMWSTQDCVSLDKVPYIGDFSNLMPHLYIATGYKKWGMTTAHVAAKIIKDRILGIENEYNEIYKATRMAPLKNHAEFGNMLKQTVYSLGINKLKTPKYKFKDLKKNSGGVVEYKGKKLGIYKDNNGKIFAVKPYCKHLGCELSWNNLEKTWDCPCHGSRYDYTGKLITEPATQDLDIYE